MKKTTRRIVGVMLAAAMTAASLPGAGVSSYVPQFVRTVEAAAAITIDKTNTGGGFETAWTEWSADTSGVAGFAVSYAKSGGSYTKIDDKLIRQYKDGHWRADVPGLSAGSYTLKIEGLDSSSKTVVQAVTSAVEVKAHERTGYAFADTSYDGGACGAYKADGTPKSNAEIIYITKASDIDTVTSNGKTGLSTILQGRDKITSDPLIVRIIGKIDYSGSQLNGSGYIQIKPSKTYTKSNITVEGIGPDATVNFGFLLRNAGGVEVRNLAIHDFKDDGISLDTANRNIWVHNNEIFYGVQGSGDKAKGDGATDVKNDSQYVTISYNHYWDGGKVSLCGMKSESGKNYITYHHNWFDHSDSRHPRIRTMSVHVFNNYYDGNAKYGVGASEGSSAFVEFNYFRNCKYPTLQGSVGCDDDGSGGSVTLEDSNPIGAVKLYGNTFVTPNEKWGYDSGSSSAGTRDGCMASARNASISYTTEAGATYNNFDTTDSFGKYAQSITPDSPETAKSKVETYAGRTGGGDFKVATGFTFDNFADDASYAINDKLRKALTNYSANSLNNKYVIKSIGGAVDTNFVPETQATTEASTEATTAKVETPTEATTSKPVSDEVVTVNYNSGYTFTGSGTLTKDSSYGGAYCEVVNTPAGGENKVIVSNGSAAVIDTDTAAQTNLVLPLPSMTGGKITISGTLTPSVNNSKWTLLQVHGTEGEVASIRTYNSKYGLRVDGGADSTIVSTSTAVTANTAVSYKLVIDLDSKKATLTVGGSTTSETSFTHGSVNKLMFVTATAARNVTVGNITVSAENSTVTVLKGDVNLDGTVNNTDVLLALQYLSGSASLDSEKISRGDIDGDGKLTIVDAFKIKEIAG